MQVARPEFVPDASLSREEMEALQREIADAAVFADDLPFDPDRICGDGVATDTDQTSLADVDGDITSADDPPLVAGVDQAFVDDHAVSAVVLLRGGEVVERAYAVEPAAIPYIPGLLSFREGTAILAAFDALEREPDIALVDGSGRIHFREAGIATHVGVTLDLPTVGVAKSLLCGTPRESLDRKLPAGARVAIESDADVETAEPGTHIGDAVQTRQFENSERYVNPLIVSPGHRVSADTAADVALACADGYKLPEPTRLADSYADEVKAEVREELD
ncbi:endonuclease V [Halosimplex carlsbadense 2-9-1]|uniref:Endonuclease V n=1 Tax=Halosimplex carlsbadense 2-9-1 TaxID=797114 RepID=M0CW30_9EURY|nr:endonuclease V [Halosimplex carlsbadense]ELZ27415.1 endonuclease V [Halosimplex carlsbadense 2-9-1]